KSANRDHLQFCIMIEHCVLVSTIFTIITNLVKLNFIQELKSYFSQTIATNNHHYASGGSWIEKIRAMAVALILAKHQCDDLILLFINKLL
ncbi:unnamed protein product, partial [Rotaria magnacalcarata]